MIDGAAIHSAGGAFLAGLVTSLHCVGMCGPLACGVGGGKGAAAQVSASLYHGGRFLSYTVLGCVAGAIGAEPLNLLLDSPAVVLPWTLVIVFLLVATGLERRLPKPKFLVRFSARLKMKIFKMSQQRGALLLGLATPLLPCAPLYLVVTAALLSGSAAKGAEFMAAFALGTVPLLWVAQGSFNQLRAWMTPQAFDWTRRGLAVAAAAMMAWRLRGTLFFMESTQGVPDCCPPGL